MADQPYTEADVELVIEAHAAGAWSKDERRDAAIDILDALAAAGRLLPEGGSGLNCDEPLDAEYPCSTVKVISSALGVSTDG